MLKFLDRLDEGLKAGAFEGMDATGEQLAGGSSGGEGRCRRMTRGAGL